MRGTEGLRTDQAPPLAIPMAFFLTSPLALMAAGVVLLLHPTTLSLTRWMPQTMGLVHLGTLGFLGMTMIGALYQMLPVVAGAPIPAIRLAHTVHAAIAAGTVALFFTLSAFERGAALGALLGLGAGVLLFLGPLCVALLRAPTRTATVWGMWVAVLAFAGLVALGLRQVWAYWGGPWLDDRALVVLTHAGLGLVGWIGGLIAAISLQVVPMFYLTPGYSRRASRSLIGGVALAVIGIVAFAAAGIAPLAPVALGGAVVWLLHPALTVDRIRRRRRRRRDASLNFWYAGLAIAPLVAICGVLSAVSADPRWPLLFGWLAIYGWAGLILHGMQTRIVPFLVWFHRFSAFAGLRPIPSMKQIYPDRRARRGLWVHGAAVASGAAAILLRQPLLAQLTGVLLIGAGLSLIHGQLGALSHRAPTPEPPAD